MIAGRYFDRVRSTGPQQPARREGSPLQPRGDETPWGASERASEKESWLEVSESGSKAGLDPVESAEVTSLPHKRHTRERTRGGSLTRFTDALERCATDTSSSVGYTHQTAVTHTRSGAEPLPTIRRLLGDKCNDRHKACRPHVSLLFRYNIVCLFVKDRDAPSVTPFSYK